MGLKKQKIMQVEVDMKCMETKLVSVVSLVSEILPLFRLPSKWPKFPFRPWTIVHGGQQIESAQKIHAGRGCCEMHGNQLWWAWLLQFRRFCHFSFVFKMAKISLPTMDYSPWGSKNRIG